MREHYQTELLDLLSVDGKSRDLALTQMERTPIQELIGDTIELRQLYASQAIRNLPKLEVSSLQASAPSAGTLNDKTRELLDRSKTLLAEQTVQDALQSPFGVITTSHKIIRLWIKYRDNVLPTVDLEGLFYFISNTYYRNTHDKLLNYCFEAAEKMGNTELMEDICWIGYYKYPEYHSWAHRLANILESKAPFATQIILQESFEIAHRSGTPSQIRACRNRLVNFFSSLDALENIKVLVPKWKGVKRDFEFAKPKEFDFQLNHLLVDRFSEKTDFLYFPWVATRCRLHFICQFGSPAEIRKASSLASKMAAHGWNIELVDVFTPPSSTPLADTELKERTASASAPTPQDLLNIPTLFSSKVEILHRHTVMLEQRRRIASIG